MKKSERPVAQAAAPDDDSTRSDSANRLTELGHSLAERPLKPSPDRATLDRRVAAIVGRRQRRRRIMAIAASALIVAGISGVIVRSTNPSIVTTTTDGPPTGSTPMGLAPPALDPDRDLTFDLAGGVATIGSATTVEIRNNTAKAISMCSHWPLHRWNGARYEPDDSLFLNLVSGQITHIGSSIGLDCAPVWYLANASAFHPFRLNDVIRWEYPSDANPTGRTPDPDAFRPGWYSVSADGADVNAAPLGQFLVQSAPSESIQLEPPPLLDGDRRVGLAAVPSASSLTITALSEFPTCHRFGLRRWNGNAWLDAGTLVVDPASGAVVRHDRTLDSPCLNITYGPWLATTIPFDLRAATNAWASDQKAAAPDDERYLPLRPGWYGLADVPSAAANNTPTTTTFEGPLLGQFQVDWNPDECYGCGMPPISQLTNPSARFLTMPSPSSCTAQHLRDALDLPRRRWDRVARIEPTSLRNALGGHTLTLGPVQSIVAVPAVPITIPSPGLVLPSDPPLEGRSRIPTVTITVVPGEGWLARMWVPISWTYNEEDLSRVRRFAEGSTLIGCIAMLVTPGQFGSPTVGLPPFGTLILQADDGSLVADDPALDPLLEGLSWTDVLQASGGRLDDGLLTAYSDRSPSTVPTADGSSAPK